MKLESLLGTDHKKRVILVDDHPMVSDQLRLLIQNEPGLVVCGQAADRAEALQSFESTCPHLAIVDLSLKNSSGLELIKDFHLRDPKLLVIVLTMHDEAEYGMRALQAGA